MRLPSTDRGAIDKLKNHFSKIQIADLDGDLDRDPYVAGAWNPMTLSDTAAGTIDWVVTFGLPEIPKLVWLLVHVRDVASGGGAYGIEFRAKATTTLASITARAERANNDSLRTTHGVVAVADNGTSHYLVTASGVNTMDAWIRLVAWTR